MRLHCISYQSIPEVDDEVSDVTSEPGTPNDNKPITASRAKGHTLNNKTHNYCMNVMIVFLRKHDTDLTVSTLYMYCKNPNF